MMSIQGNINTVIGTAAVLNKLGEPVRQQKKAEQAESERLGRIAELNDAEAQKLAEKTEAKYKQRGQLRNQYKDQVKESEAIGPDVATATETLTNMQGLNDELLNLSKQGADVYGNTADAYKQAYIRTGNEQYLQGYKDYSRNSRNAGLLQNKFYNYDPYIKQELNKMKAYKTLQSEYANNYGINDSVKGRELWLRDKGKVKGAVKRYRTFDVPIQARFNEILEGGNK